MLLLQALRVLQRQVIEGSFDRSQGKVMADVNALLAQRQRQLILGESLCCAAVDIA